MVSQQAFSLRDIKQLFNYSISALYPHVISEETFIKLAIYEAVDFPSLFLLYFLVANEKGAMEYILNTYSLTII